MLDHIAREMKTNLHTLGSALKGAGIALPAALKKELGTLPKVPGVPTHNPRKLAQAYLSAKGDPLEDPTVRREILLATVGPHDLLDAVESEVIKMEHATYESHVEALFTACQKVVEDGYPILKNAVEAGIEDLQNPNVTSLDAPQISAMVDARTTNLRIRKAVDAWKGIARLIGRSPGPHIHPVLAELPYWDYIGYRDVKPDPFRLVLDGHALSLPTNWEEFSERNERVQAEGRALNAKQAEDRKKHVIGAFTR